MLRFTIFIGKGRGQTLQLASTIGMRTRLTTRFQPQAGLKLSLLRGFELSGEAGPVRLPLSAQRVVAFLALQARPLARIFVAGTLWIDASEQRANAALRTALWRIGEPGEQLVHCDGQMLALAPSVDVDLSEATHRAHEVLDAGGNGATTTTGDLRLLGDAGDLLPDWYEDWVLIERERFRQLRLHALEAMCRQLSAGGRHAEATEAGIAAIACEPLRESAHRALVGAHLAEGNAAEALRQYRFCGDLFHRELGIELTDEFERMVAPLTRR